MNRRAAADTNIKGEKGALNHRVYPHGLGPYVFHPQRKVSMQGQGWGWGRQTGVPQPIRSPRATLHPRDVTIAVREGVWLHAVKRHGSKRRTRGLRGKKEIREENPAPTPHTYAR